MHRIGVPTSRPRSAACGFARASHVWVIALLLAHCTQSFAQTTRPTGGGRREKPAIQRAIDLLIAEGEQSRKGEKLVRVEADFAATFKEEIPEDALLKALTQPVHAQAFIDAYVRWQLTSFNPVLPVLDDRQFARLMAATPELLANPCAREETIAAFEKGESAANLTAREIERARETWSELNRQRQVIETLNTPALQWRQWIDNQLPARGPRKIQWNIERVASTIAGGWDTRDAKGDLTRAAKDLGQSVGDLALTPPQTNMVCEQIQRLRGLKRRMIEDVAFLANGRLDVTFANLYVSENDIEKWVEALRGTVSP
jgi:hypothetical protein